MINLHDLLNRLYTVYNINNKIKSYMDMDMDMDMDLNSNNIIQVLFEQIASSPDTWNNLRQCREMEVPSNIGEIQPGQYCELFVEGGGYYCQWYYYRTLDNRHMLIFRSPNIDTNDFSYSGRQIYDIPRSFGLYQEIPFDSLLSSFDDRIDMDIQYQPPQQ